MNLICFPLLFLGALACASTAHADDTLPDPLFGNGGTVTVESTNNDVAAPQPVVLLQGTDTYVLNHLWRNDVYVSRVSRFDAFGNIDPNYGLAGHTELAGLDGFYDHYFWNNSIVDAEGRLYLVGRATLGSNHNMLACRLQPDGQFDGSWGGNGTGCTTIAFDEIASGSDSASVLALQPNGRLLVGGQVEGIDGYLMGVARLNAAGTLDQGFNGGTGTTIIAHPNWMEFNAAGIALDSEQRIIVAGTVGMSKTSSDQCDQDYAIARLLPDGTPDETFPVTAVAWNLGPMVGQDCSMTSDVMVRGGLHVYPDDSVLLLGNAQVGQPDDLIAAVKVTDDAALDGSFGGGSGKISRFACDVCIYTSVISSTVQSDGAIVIVGKTNIGMGDDVFVTRLLPNGDDDPGFAGSGALLFDYASGSEPSNDVPGFVDAGAGRIVFPVISDDLSLPDDEKLHLTALGALDNAPPEEGISLVFADDFE